MVGKDILDVLAGDDVDLLVRLLQKGGELLDLRPLGCGEGWIGSAGGGGNGQGREFWGGLVVIFAGFYGAGAGDWGGDGGVGRVVVVMVVVLSFDGGG